MDIFRQAPVGSLLRIATGNRILPYDEQKPGYSHPGRHVEVDDNAAASRSNSTLVADEDRDADAPKDKSNGQPQDASDPEKGAKQETPKKKVHDPTYVHWRGDDDPDSPLNWSTGKKLYVTSLLGLYTAVVCASRGFDGQADRADIASAIVTNTAGIQYLSEQFGNPKQSEITLGLTLFVFGCPCDRALRWLTTADSIAPLVLTPLTALPRYGRQWPFLISCVQRSLRATDGQILLLHCLLDRLGRCAEPAWLSRSAAALRSCRFARDLDRRRQLVRDLGPDACSSCECVRRRSLPHLTSPSRHLGLFRHRRTRHGPADRRCRCRAIQHVEGTALRPRLRRCLHHRAHVRIALFRPR